ncbi:MAG: hypothetical protein E7315_02995 [Clostridiales bacterium]|nr:hypothetical protein [Clostridiales bacterium]
MRSKNACQKSEILMAREKLNFANPNNLPVSFKINGVQYNGMPESFNPKVTRKIVDSRINMYNIRGINEDGLEVNVEYYEYRDYPVVEWTVFFTNNGDSTCLRISDLLAFDALLEGNNPVLSYSTGDNCTPNDYEALKSDLNEPVTLSPLNGRACDGAFPYMRLLFDDFGYNIAIGWPGEWEANATKCEAGVKYTAKQKVLDAFIMPGETFRTPRMTVMLFEGDETRGINMWRRWYFDHVLICPEGVPLEPKYCIHATPEKGPEWCFATEEQQLQGMQKYIDNGYRPDVWWIDAGWYPNALDVEGSWWEVKKWEADEKRFPNGLYPIGKAAEENGMSFLLWFEPERVVNGSYIYEQHPEWVLLSMEKDKFLKGYSGMFDLSNKEATDWLIDHICSIIQKYNVKVFRQDYNFGPLDFWRYNEEEGRKGAIENKYIQGYLRYWDALTERNPGLWIDSCASGGRRNDLETMRRAVPLHYTDYGYGIHPMKQAQYRIHYEWIPYFRAMLTSWDNDEGTYEPTVNREIDEYAYHVGMGPATTNYRSCNCTNKADIDFDIKMAPIWRKAAEIMLKSDFYLMTEIRKSPEDWCVWQFNCPEEDIGYLHAVRNTLSPDESFVAKLVDLDENANYRLQDLINDREIIMSGRDLIHGLKISLEKRSGVLWFYNKI